MKQEKTQELYEKILQKRAERLNVTAEKAAYFEGEDPLMLAAKERAKLEGITPDEVLKQYKERLMKSGYPTPDCLTADEVLEYSDSGKLPEARRSHVDNCEECTALLSATYPSEDTIRILLEKLQEQKSGDPPQHAAHIGYESAAEANAMTSLLEKAVLTKENQGRQAAANFFFSFIGAFAAVILLVLVFPIGQGFLHLRYPSSPQAEIAKLSAQLNELQSRVEDTRKLAVSAEVAPYLIGASKSFKKGEFISIPEPARRSTAAALPQERVVEFKVTDPGRLEAALEKWKTISTAELGLQPVIRGSETSGGTATSLSTPQQPPK